MKNKNLIIGSTSQLSFYFPNHFDRISSRNIDFKVIKKTKYDKIFLLFAEQRTFLNEDENFFNLINFEFTLEVINRIKDFCNQVIIFSTSELWNAYNGVVKLQDPYLYNFSPYIKSKENLCNHINEYRNKFQNISIVYPFNFNSPYRKDGFLFSKIFKSIIKEEIITIGNTNFYRDILHPSVIVNNCLNIDNDILIGGGELIKISNFIRDLYSNFSMDYKKFIEVQDDFNLHNKRNEYFSETRYSSYQELLNLTTYDIRKYKIS